ncbi:MAG: alpha-1,2-fucosyltransferase [Candidatus Falkowbacteria bacterium]
MIITKLTGGLGNQMFQYAVGRAVAERNKTNLKIDLSGYEHQIGITPRQYELFLFNIQEDFSTLEENKKIKGLELNGFLKRLLNKLHVRLGSSNYIIEKHHNFDPTILKLEDGVYLEGYWQTEKYFSDIADIIRLEFTLKDKYNNLNPEILNKIDSYNSVSMHIRRGDYVSNQETSEYHGICSLEYYRKAISLIAEKSPNPVVFIFSDDLKWCEENLKIDWPIVFVEGNKGYEDLIMMSRCKHNIIANSSFSWWGAWLNNNPSKMVIAPAEWFADKSINTTDVVPESWTKI